MEINFEEDEKRDRGLIKEALDKNATYADAAKWLTSHLIIRYGPEFGGVIGIEYDIISNKFTLKCGTGSRIFEEEELMDMPGHIQFLRKMKSK
ncbi:hypothetical protein ACFLZZ_03865 [Nanoarchaeota archaeon]